VVDARLRGEDEGVGDREPRHAVDLVRPVGRDDEVVVRILEDEVGAGVPGDPGQ